MNPERDSSFFLLNISVFILNNDCVVNNIEGLIFSLWHYLQKENWLRGD